MTKALNAIADASCVVSQSVRTLPERICSLIQRLLLLAHKSRLARPFFCYIANDGRCLLNSTISLFGDVRGGLRSRDGFVNLFLSCPKVAIQAYQLESPPTDKNQGEGNDYDKERLVAGCQHSRLLSNGVLYQKLKCLRIGDSLYLWAYDLA